MSLGWDSLPLLPLGCILKHLSTEDALAAMSTCRHWRNAMLLYEGRKETLKLRAQDLEKNLFLTRIFRKYTNKLLVFVNCTEEELENFMTFVLPQYFDTIKLNEISFVGPYYFKHSQNAPNFKLKRILIESMVFKHSHCIQKLALMGCTMDEQVNGKDRFIHKNVEYYSRPLSFNSVSPADMVLSRCNTDLIGFSTLKHILVEYDQISTEAVETLSHLANLTHLSLNITQRQASFEPVEWRRLGPRFARGLDVAVNIIALPYNKFKDVIENVLVDGMNVTSLKVMFCKTLCAALVAHAAHAYAGSLAELLWADTPYDSALAVARIVKSAAQPQERPSTYNLNPFILLCWQCHRLRRLVIHGYWVWQYDLLGFVRLRNSLTELQVSAIYSRQGRFSGDDDADDTRAVRVLVGDAPTSADLDYIREVNQYTEFEWKPTAWRALHPALRAHSGPAHRAEYVAREASAPLTLA